MDCAETVGASATRKRPHATLVEHAEESLRQDQSIVVGSWLSGRAVARSGLLSGVGDTAGLAALPSQLSPEEIRLWETAYIVDMDMMPGDIVTVWKVADALGDENSDTWATKLANMAQATFKQPRSSDIDAMLGALLRLPPHLLPRILSTCLSQTTLSDTLLTFPAPLHPAIMSVAAANGTLGFNQQVASTALTLLPLTAVPSPGLVQLDIASLTTDDSPPSTGALLARAASAHPTLTRLSLDAAPLLPQWLRSFSDCLFLGALPKLADLALCVNAHPGGYAEVAACLTLLPSLTSLSILFHLPDEPDAASEPLAAYTRLTAAPASLPCLQSLLFQEASVSHMYTPHRLQLDDRVLSISPQRSRVNSFLSLLTAPALTRLSLTLHTMRLPLGILVPQLLRFPALEDIAITAALQAIGHQLQHTEGANSARLPALKSVRVDSSCPASRAAVCAAIAELGTSTLTAVNLSLDDTGTHPNPCTPAEFYAARLRFCAVLRECTRVQRLDFQQSLSDATPSMAAEYSSRLSSALGRLTLLTHLKLVSGPDERVELNGHEFGHALSQLVALESLTIDSGLGALEFDVAEPVTVACTALTRVTFLSLCFDGITPALVTDFPHRLVSLRRLEFGEGVFTPGELAAFAARFTNAEVGIA